MTSPQFAFDDFFPNTRQIATVGGQLIGVPLYPEVQLLYYRKDVFKAKNVAVPQTMEEWEAAAKKLTDKSNNFYGYVSRDKRSAAVYTLAHSSSISAGSGSTRTTSRSSTRRPR